MTSVQADRARPVRLLHISQSDCEGGANRAAFRLHRALMKAGAQSTFHVGRKLTDERDVVGQQTWREFSDVTAYLNAAPLKLYRNRRGDPFSPISLSYGRLRQPLIADAEVVILHWIAGAFLRPEQLLSIRKPLIWRLSDLWPFTGGCHYSGGCRGFEAHCGTCPCLGSQSATDLSSFGYRLRASAYSALDLTVAAPSRWIAEEARASSLFGDKRIEVVPTGIDVEIFRPYDKAAARSSLNLPIDRRIVLFGALGATEDPRKGYKQLQQSLHRLADTSDGQPMLAIVGSSNLGDQSHLMPATYFGRVESEERMAMLYSAADVVVAPSLEDNLPNVVLEALACGTPVVAFAAGGIPDAIEHKRNGWLAGVGNAEDLAAGIAWVLQDVQRHVDLCRNARRKAISEFDLAACAQRYLNLAVELAAR